MSLGRAAFHDFREKVRQASLAGFKGIEIFYEDLEYLAAKHVSAAEDSKESSPAPSSDDGSALLTAAQEARDACDKCSLTIIGLQPFLFYEGLLDRKDHEAKIQKLKLWFKIVKILGTDIIQIPSNFKSTGISGDMDLIVRDLTEVADLGLRESPPIRFVYENIAWATYIDTWELLWEVVERVDRPNFGCCLDAFHIAGRVWADPASATGKTHNADEDLRVSLANMAKTIDVTKVFYIQVADAERMQTPLVEGHPFHVDGQPPRMNWSRNARLFPYEEDLGGYMPVVQVAKVFLHDLGYSGWVSMELFSRTMSDPSPDIPHNHAQRGFKSWQRLASELKLQH